MKDQPIVDRLTVLDRDITKQQVDAIVNAANSSLLATPKAERARTAVRPGWPRAMVHTGRTRNDLWTFPEDVRCLESNRFSAGLPT